MASGIERAAAQYVVPGHRPGPSWRLTPSSHKRQAPKRLAPGIGARQVHVGARLTCTSWRMASEHVTPFHPPSAAWGAHPSGVKDEIVDLAIWREHNHPKRAGRARPRLDLATTHPRPGAAVVDLGGDDRRPTTALAKPVRARVLPGAHRTGA